MTCRSSLSLSLAIAGALVAPASASALQIGVQDQGVGPDALMAVGGLLGASDARLVVRPSDPQAGLVSEYRERGMRVQAAIVVKRDTTAGDIRSVMRAWHGQVRTVSIGNEPELNGVPACTYARLYRRTYALIRREFPGVHVGFGEFSPNGAVEYSSAVMRCKGPRLRADFWGWHAYQPAVDPLDPGNTQRTGATYAWTHGQEAGYWGIGKAGRIHRYLASRATRKRLSTRAGRALPIRITEFSYLVSGRYAITQQRAAWLWPRAVRQARKWAQQLVIYGTGPVAAGSWGDASLIGRDGRRLPGFVALARALGRILPPEHEPPVPVVPGPLPGLPDVPPLAHGEGKAESTVVPEPERPIEEAPVAEPEPDTSEPAPDQPAPDAPQEPVEAPES
jgi:hypothetical protein